MTLIHECGPENDVSSAIELVPRPPAVTSFKPIIEPTQSSMPLNNVESSPLVHPFTMQICGPTSSGKTVWLKKLLACDVIQPPIQRIVWCYGQWQPAYEQMSRTLPNIEFVPGIPDGLEHDSYFYTSVNNLIVLDDLMTSAKNDNRVGDLFTKGSHHCFLSTIYWSKTYLLKEKPCATYHSTVNTWYCLIRP
jgi:hypothetical protein